MIAQVGFKGGYPLTRHVHEADAVDALRDRAAQVGLAGTFSIVHTP